MTRNKSNKSSKKTDDIKMQMVRRGVRGRDDIWQRNPEIIKSFLEARRDYEQLCAEVEYTLRKKITKRGIEASSITSRAKTLNSFLDKLQRKHYDSPLDRITDLAGVRVVCLYRDDIAKIGEIIRSDFDIVEDIDKVDEMAVDQFGYGARHFVVRLGRTHSGARYDDLKQLLCEIQVRTVVQDAWAIIQHHMVYKRESQVPSQLQRKLNSLAGLFETVDDQFERIRIERESYLAGVRESVGQADIFLENELNLDSYKEYLTWRFPGRGIESWNGQARMGLDGLTNAGYKTLRDVEKALKETSSEREAIIKALGKEVKLCADGTVPSNLEPALALAILTPNWEELIRWGPWVDIIRAHRGEKKEHKKKELPT